jgi:glycosyltransferase involved in cell wall biosynthesis
MDPGTTRILFFGTYPNLPLGYSKISNIITNYLANQQRVRVYHLGVSNFEGQQVERFIHPGITLIDAIKLSRRLKNSDELYGVDVIDHVIERIKPHVFIIYTDCIVTCRLFNELFAYRQRHPGQTRFVCYLDLVYSYQKSRYLNFIGQQADHIFVFSKYWKENMVAMGIPDSKLSIFAHGINRSIYMRVDREEARRFMGFGKDDFVVLNTNRNSYRKAHDIGIRAFVMFLKMADYPRGAKYFVNLECRAGLDYSLEDVIETECCRLGAPYDLVVNHHILSFPNETRSKVSDQAINVLYNACDIGINTCIGEGFGLCNAEHASVDRPQVVTNVGGLRDIFAPFPIMLVDPVAVITVPNKQDDHNGDAHICKAEDFAQRIHHLYTHPEEREELGRRVGEHIRQTYDWDKLLPAFCDRVQELGIDLHRGAPK